MPLFNLVSKYVPTGDQPQAITEIVESLKTEEEKYRTILWVTGSGKTFTMANIISQMDRPALIIAHNKTLAAQLAQEFKEYFPDNAVHYFVSYYDYYQPEAYIVKTDTYIEKEATINEEIDRLRHAATESLLTRKDVIIVASVSCIYSLGDVSEYMWQVLEVQTGKTYVFEDLIDNLIRLQFRRATYDFGPGMFQIMGDTIDIFPSSSETIWSLEFFWNDLDRISRRNHFTGEVYENAEKINIFPAKHTIAAAGKIEEILPKIKEELTTRLKYFAETGDLVKAERIKTKVEYDLEMMAEVGYVNGIENYSMYISGRSPGDTPSTLMDFFPEWYLTFIDESHMTIPQIGGMYAGDRARKTNLIENGFRLPTAFENRPLRFEEFEKKTEKIVCVSATPSAYELDHSKTIARQVIRPTGLLDPKIEIEDMKYVVDSLMKHINAAKKRGERALLTTLTKKSSEELAEFLASNGIKVAYLHSEVETLDRLEILRNLRMGKTEVIVWVNLLREWLDLPEVSFIGILDAEKQGFLRSTQALLQIVGRAARNVNGTVVMYSREKIISDAMARTIQITDDRRAIQHTYNIEHDITPQTIYSTIKDMGIPKKRDYTLHEEWGNLETKIRRLELEMDVAATNLDFELAAELRDAIIDLNKGKKK